jgi:hypothetical protein
MSAYAPLFAAVLANGLSANALRAAQPYTIPPERSSTVTKQSWFMGPSGAPLSSMTLFPAALDFDRAIS